MSLELNILVMIMEIIYYSLFMRFSRNEGKMSKYIISFSLISLFGVVAGTNNLFSYLFLIIFILLSLKYIVKIKTRFYDMFIIFVMLLIKILIETIFAFIFIIFIKEVSVVMLLLSIIKIIFILLMNKKMNKFYNYFEIQWYKNKFYIRYTFDVLMFLYVIISCLFLILNR